jgi:hypothetical protein
MKVCTGLFTSQSATGTSIIGGRTFNVVGIAPANAAPGLRQVVFVLGTLHNGDWKRRQREEQGVQTKPLLLGEGIEVLEELIVGGSRRENLLDLFMPEHQSRASADDR